MTYNQIEYWKLQENKRANQANETETSTHNRNTEYETGRHNRATEQIDLSKLAETTRHNKVTEHQGYLTIAETGRHNRATEGETTRSNLSNEAIKRANLGLGYSQLSETSRANRAQEYLKGVDLSINQGYLSEQVRHNMNNESISRFNADSQAALNQANAALANVRSTWEGLLNSSQISLNDARKQQINAEITKISQEIANLQSQKKGQDQNNFWKTYDEVMNGARSLSNYLND